MDEQKTAAKPRFMKPRLQKEANCRRRAGEDVIGEYLNSKKEFADEVMRPLQAKIEPVYVVPGSDAEAHVRKRYPHKTIRHVRNRIRTLSVMAFLRGLPLAFQRQMAANLDAVYHFTFTGTESTEATVTI